MPVDFQRKVFRTSGTRAMERQPDFLKGGGQLRDYQLDGLNWMIYSWSQDNNCILADEVLSEGSPRSCSVPATSTASSCSW